MVKVLIIRSTSAGEIAPPLAPAVCVCAEITGADSEERTRMAAKNIGSFNNRFVLIFQILEVEVLDPRSVFALFTGGQMPEKKLMLPTRRLPRKTE